MNPVFCIFIDGLKPESLEYMSFLNTFYKKRIKTELIGYSNTCHASIYSGVYPNKHHLQFIWKYSPKTSPFNVLKKIKIHHLPHNLVSKFFFYRIALLLRGIPFNLFFSGLSRQPIDNWSNFDFEEVKFWGEPASYLGGYPTFFKILKNNGYPYEIVGMNYTAHKSLRKIIKHKIKKTTLLTYYFIGDIDPLSDKYGQDSYIVKKRLKEIDDMIQIKYKDYKKMFDDFDFIVFSDHGHMKVKKHVDLYSVFNTNNKNLNDYIHFIDAIQLRIWYRNNNEKNEVMNIIEKMKDIGYIITTDIMKEYHSEVPDNRYGDLIFYIDYPYISNTTPVVSMHGYSPEYPGSDGVFIANKKMVDKSYVILEDIAPTILTSLNIVVPKYMDGKSLWQ